MGTRLMQLVAASPAGFLVSAPKTPTCLRGARGSILDLFLSTGECFPVRTLEWATTDHVPICGVCYLDDFPPPPQLNSCRGSWRPQMPVCWAKVTDELRRSFVQAARARFRRPLPDTVDEAARWFVHTLHRSSRMLPLQVPGVKNHVVVPVLKLRAQALEAQAAFGALQDGASETQRKEHLAAACAKLKAYKDACMTSLGSLDSNTDVVGAWKMYRRAAMVQHTGTPVGVRFPDSIQGASVADQFNHLYASKSVILTPVFPPTLPGPTTIPPVSVAELRAALAECASGKAADFDGITVELLRLLPVKARSVLRALMTIVLQEGLPVEWRCCVITPVYKRGKPVDDAKSYRPEPDPSFFN